MGIRACLAGSAALTASIVLAGTGAGPAVTPGAAAPPVAAGARVAAIRTARAAGSTAVIPGTGTAKATTATAATATAATPKATAGLAVSTTSARVTAPRTPIHVGICMGPPGYRALESQLSTEITSALHGRSGDHAVTVFDRVTSVYCTLEGGRHFDSASIVKAIILAALLRWHQETGTPLSANERYLATLMITQSDNDAATDLWYELGMSRLQHFLDLAKMSETELGADGYWGLTQVTAHDEMLLLELLAQKNPVLSNSSRSYQLGLMARVIGSEAWGVTAGTPSGVTWHVKNGWLPDGDADEWHINSIGAFAGSGQDYMIAVLTDANPSERYGIDTIENVARPVQKAINAARPPVTRRIAASGAGSAAPSGPAPAPWAAVPALPVPARTGG